VNALFINGSAGNFVYTYYLQNKRQIDQYTSVDDYVRRFDRVNDMWNGFVAHAARDSVNLNTVTPAQKETLQRRLEAYLGRFRWRNNGYYQVLNSDDAVIKKALEEVKK